MIAETETSPIFKKMGEGTEGAAMNMDSCKLDWCVDKGREMIGWDAKYSDKTIENDVVKGVGMAIAMQGSGISYIDMASAVIKLNDRGFYNLIIGATDIGQGSDTILAQIAAEALGCDLEDVVVYSSDTDLTPFDTGAYASSTTYVSGNAVMKAAENMRQMIIEEGAKALEVAINKIDYDGKILKVIDSDEQMTLEDLSNRLIYNEDQRQLVATDSYVGTKSPPPFMAGYVEVAVDKGTGQVTVLDYAAAVDCGTTINPLLAKVQVEGGLLQGIGMAMYEEVLYDKKGGQITNDLMNYRIPTRKEVTSMQVAFADSYEESGPYGAKSVGEIGIDTPPAAIANAIYNAVGVRIKSLPITAEKVLMALKEKE